ncbi:hypothetical protein KY347_06170 [Candidatus Woesearchaeota archaeon]|nr:hypothetical protein [Candidatus Woesearchaeota archaeon]
MKIPVGLVPTWVRNDKVRRKSYSPHFIKMMFAIVAIICILFAVFLIYTFVSYASLVLNLIILIALCFLIIKDLKDKDNHKYYLISLLLTAIFLISSNTALIKSLLALADKILLSIAIVSVIAVYLFAHLAALVYESYHYLKEKYRR